eukprot:sb/3467661/
MSLYQLVSIPKCRFRILTLLCLFAKQKGIRVDAFGINPGREKIKISQFRDYNLSVAILYELPLPPAHSPVKMDEASVPCLQYPVNVKVGKVAKIVWQPFRPTNLISFGIIMVLVTKSGWPLNRVNGSQINRKLILDFRQISKPFMVILAHVLKRSTRAGKKFGGYMFSKRGQRCQFENESGNLSSQLTAVSFWHNTNIVIIILLVVFFASELNRLEQCTCNAEWEKIKVTYPPLSVRARPSPDIFLVSSLLNLDLISLYNNNLTGRYLCDRLLLHKTLYMTKAFVDIFE